ncbi:MAG: radical SAM protein [Deltaproteobacteria bacterium]|nr:radical SAM protein [Deltaproteobacteria bacterium]
MRVLLISANTETINMPVLPIGLGSVAAAAEREGHEVRMLDLMEADDPAVAVREALGSLKPAVIGISVRNIDDQSMTAPRFLVDQVRDVVSWCRESSSAPIVLGGSGYSIFPEGVLAYLGADLGIQGEGERAFPILLSCMEEGAGLSGVPGLYVAGRGQVGERRFEKCLDDLPMPEPRRWTTSGARPSETWVPFQTRRGCPMKCSYCSTGTIEGKTIRKRSVSGVVDTLARYAHAGYTRFHFVDNTFNLPPSYARAFCLALEERRLGLLWRTIVYPGSLSPGLVKSMRKAGCSEVSLGFESGSDRMLRSMNKRFGREEVRLASEMLGGEGIRRMGFLLLGGPGETRESVEESFAFVDSLNLEAIKVTLGIRIYPYTALAATALREGIIGPGESLLLPRFYMARGLEDWLPATVREWAGGRPNVFM